MKKRRYILNKDIPVTASTLLVCWEPDVGQIGRQTYGYISTHAASHEVATIDPDSFYTMDSVMIEDNVAVFPDNRFLYCPQGDLIIFKGYHPDQEWYDFIGAILDVAQHYGVNCIYTVGGMISVTPHSTPRELLTVANSAELAYNLEQYDPVTRRIEQYETPPGHRPTINAYILWAAGKRKMDAACLWIPVPFYMAPGEDPQAVRRILDFLILKLNLHIDFGDINVSITLQSDKINELRNINADIDSAIRALENDLSISGGESQRLINNVQQFLKGK